MLLPLPAELGGSCAMLGIPWVLRSDLRRLLPLEQRTLALDAPAVA